MEYLAPLRFQIGYLTTAAQPCQMQHRSHYSQQYQQPSMVPGVRPTQTTGQGNNAGTDLRDQACKELARCPRCRCRAVIFWWQRGLGAPELSHLCLVDRSLLHPPGRPVFQNLLTGPAWDVAASRSHPRKEMQGRRMARIAHRTI